MAYAIVVAPGARPVDSLRKDRQTLPKHRAIKDCVSILLQHDADTRVTKPTPLGPSVDTDTKSNVLVSTRLVRTIFTILADGRLGVEAAGPVLRTMAAAAAAARPRSLLNNRPGHGQSSLSCAGGRKLHVDTLRLPDNDAAMDMLMAANRDKKWPQWCAGCYAVVTGTYATSGFVSVADLLAVLATFTLQQHQTLRRRVARVLRGMCPPPDVVSHACKLPAPHSYEFLAEALQTNAMPTLGKCILRFNLANQESLVAFRISPSAHKTVLELQAKGFATEVSALDVAEEMTHLGGGTYAIPEILSLAKRLAATRVCDPAAGPDECSVAGVLKINPPDRYVVPVPASTTVGEAIGLNQLRGHNYVVEAGCSAAVRSLLSNRINFSAKEPELPVDPPVFSARVVCNIRDIANPARDWPPPTSATQLTVCYPSRAGPRLEDLHRLADFLDANPLNSCTLVGVSARSPCNLLGQLAAYLNGDTKTKTIFDFV